MLCRISRDLRYLEDRLTLQSKTTCGGTRLSSIVEHRSNDIYTDHPQKMGGTVLHKTLEVFLKVEFRNDEDRHLRKNHKVKLLRRL